MTHNSAWPDRSEQIKLNRRYNAFTYLSETTAPKLKSPTRQALSGWTIGVKDNICVEGMPLTCGSRLLQSYIAPYSATAVDLLVKAGASIAGKTNLDEFGMGSSTEYSCFGVTMNPRVSDHVAGGSSGGSAAAVAAKLCRAALGSDTGGSVLLPSAFCGVYGLRPTWGLVSRYGLTAFASSMDTIGPIAGNLEDLELLFNTINHPDPRDATSLPASERTAIPIPPKPRIGILQGWIDSLSGEIAERFINLYQVLRKLSGIEVVPADLQVDHLAMPTYLTIASAEASSNLARFDGIRYGLRAPGIEAWKQLFIKTRSQYLGPEVQRRIVMGSHVLRQNGEPYRKACIARSRISSLFSSLFRRYDLLLGPVTCGFPFRPGERDVCELYAEDRFTCPVALAGLPALSMPFCNIREFPVSLQLIAPPHGEKMLFLTGTMLRELSGD